MSEDPTDHKRVLRLSRRRVLAGLSSASLLALLAACRPRTPVPTPTPTRTPRGPTPSGTPSPSATWTPSATPPAPSPTDTATLEPTGPPTATPTPTATPFPPGPPTKLGLVITRNDPRVFDLLATGNVATICTLEYDPNFAVDIKAASPKTLLIGRITLQQLDLASLTDPEGAGQTFANQLLPIATEPRRLASFDGWQAYNEPVATDGEQMERLARFEAARTRVLAEAGVRSVIGNFGTGNPDLALWPQFRPALEAAMQHKGYLGLHEYSAPTMQYGTPQDPLGWDADPAQEGWLTLRYRKAYRSYLEPNGLVLPLILTEVGIDGMVGDRPGPPGKGWQDFAGYWDELGMGIDAPGNYMEQLAWYDANLQQDDYVRGAAIFAGAASPGWESYEILGDEQVEPFLAQYLRVHPAAGG